MTLLETARAWADADPHDGDRAEIEALVEAENWPELERRFAGPLVFGTAGLRGPLHAGPAGMNAAVVTRA
ncbi:MAG: phospho-sugar mutase, partial [Actinomycetota bacterium]|nr:phospho-sugar mutase [Actinomycetota bacterium]